MASPSPKTPHAALPSSVEPFNTKDSTQQLKKDFAKALENKAYSDATILFRSGHGAEQSFPVHRVILANRCHLFEAVFDKYKDQAHPHINLEQELKWYNQVHQTDDENTQNISDLPIDNSSFLIILRYLYCSELFITHENCLDMYTLSRHLRIDSAERACEQYIEKMKRGSEVCGLLKAALERSEMKLYAQCMESLEKKTTDCLESDMFLTVPETVVHSVVRSEKINCPEKILFDAVIRWWGANKDSILPDASKEEQDAYLLKHFLYYIRFPLMESEDIVLIERMNILPDDYILQALRFHACKDEAVVHSKTSELTEEEIYENEDFRIRTRVQGSEVFTFEDHSKAPNLSLDKKKCTVTHNGPNQKYLMAISNKKITSGVTVFEVKMDNCPISTHVMVGVCRPNTSVNQWLGQDSNGWSWFGYNATKYHGGTSPAYGSKFTTGDIIGVKLDMTKGNGTLTFFKNGISQGVAFTGIGGTPLCPAVSMRSVNDQLTLLTGPHMKYEANYFK